MLKSSQINCFMHENTKMCQNKKGQPEIYVCLYDIMCLVIMKKGYGMIE